MSKTITAVFNTRHEAETALGMLEKVGFTEDQVTILSPRKLMGSTLVLAKTAK